MMTTRKSWRKAGAVLALGGGGARGLSHLGAVQAVREAGFTLKRIVGTSIGSLVGAMCATEPVLPKAIGKAVDYVTSDKFKAKQESLCGAHPKTDTVPTSGMLAWYDRIKSYLWTRSLLTRIFHRRSLLSGQVLEEVIEALVPDIDIEESTIPLSIVTVDLKSGHQVLLERGSLRKAVLASTAIPGIFPPVEWDGMLLCDLGVLDSLPTQVARSYTDQCVIGVDVGPNLERAEECESALHILLRIDEIAERLNRRRSQRLADILVRPEVGRFQWFDFSQPERLIHAGLEAGRAAITQWRGSHAKSSSVPAIQPRIEYYSKRQKPTHRAG